MTSLRSRLVAGLLAVAAIGLLALGGITYAEQRSFLFDRIDQQAQGALGVISRTLDDRLLGAPTFGRFGGSPFDRRPRARGVLLPPGTYGERRDQQGRILAHVVLSYGEQAPAPPRLPQHVRTGLLFTVGSHGSSGLQYRVVAARDFDDPGTTVVALPLREVDQTLTRLLTVEALVIAGILVAIGLVAWWLVRLGLRPLDRMGETAGAIAAGDLSRRVSPATPQTEVGRLGLALNAMLGRLERAFAQRRESEDRLRRFLADASHELRTPLASIRGYAEVFRLGAASDPEETAKAMRRIEDEAARMGVLVEDLLTLARLDEVREPVRDRVDLAALAGEAVDDARVTAPDREISLRAEAGTDVLGDPHQLRQVVSNLLRNALTHTPAGTPVEVDVERSGPEVAATIRDHGPGLPPGPTDAIFERFWRAEGGRERGRGGAGLGLAIVAALVEAHGGRVHAADAPGGGAAFSVSLPAAPAAPALAEQPPAPAAVQPLP